MVIILIFSVLIALGLFLFFENKKTSRMDKLTANIPGPKNYPLVGAAFEFTKGADTLTNFIRQRANYGHICKARIGNILFVSLSSASDVEDVLTSYNVEKSYLYKFLAPLFGFNSVFTSNGDTWRTRRKILSPLFHIKTLEEFIEVFSSNSKILVENLKQEIGKPGFDVDQYDNLCTLDIILETSLGVRMNNQRENNMKMIHIIHEVEASVIYRAWNPWAHPDLIFNLLPEGRKQNRLVKYLMGYIQKAINLRNQGQLSQINTENLSFNAEERNEKSNYEKKGQFIDVLYHNNLPDEDVVREVITMILAGQSTISTTTSLALYALMKHQSIQEKAVEEQNSIFDGSDRNPTLADLKDMYYLETVIKETMRKWSSVPYFGRTLTDDVHLKSGYTLPAGCNVVIFLYELHRNENVFPNPDVFDPERFNRENSLKRSRYAFCPFSAGPRDCLGQLYSMLEIKVMLSYILRSYKILPPLNDLPDISLSGEVVLRSKTGVNIRLENR